LAVAFANDGEQRPSVLLQESAQKCKGSSRAGVPEAAGAGEGMLRSYSVYLWGRVKAICFSVTSFTGAPEDGTLKITHLVPFTE